MLIVDRKANELVDLITTSRTVLSSFAKAKTAKLGMHKAAYLTIEAMSYIESG